MYLSLFWEIMAFKSLKDKEKYLRSYPAGGDVSVVMAYPNRYWVAMSNLGFQTVYSLFSQHRRLQVERAFLPEDSSQAPVSFESEQSLNSVDILAISVSFETDYPSVLDFVEAAGRCLKTGERLSAWSPFILGGGAALTLNPEPLASFFDALVIGEAEEVLSEVTDTFLDIRDNNQDFESLLYRMSQIEGVYVPKFYEVAYKEDQTIHSFVPRNFAPKRVIRRYVKDLDKFPTTTVIQTPETEFKSMYMTETGRGCEVGCKFCVAGYMYRPVRKRSAEVIAETVQVGVEESNSVGFVGASVSSHKKIAQLAGSVAQQGKRAALSSIMTQKVTRELAASLSESEYKTVALAPETGSETLRFRIGKRVCNEQVLEGIRLLAREGIRNFKLYFMVGLPSEEDTDVEEIVSLVKRARDTALAAARTQKEFKIAPRVILSVNPFIPKAWTPFQRHPFLDGKIIKKKLQVVLNGVRPLSNVEMKFESPRESYFQAIMSRGDRRVGHLLLLMREQKKDWKWLVKNGDKLLVEGVPPASFYVTREFGVSEVLPWEIVDFSIQRSLLEREYRRTFVEDVGPLIARAKRALENQSTPSEGVVS